jgi:transposase-like protein
MCRDNREKKCPTCESDNVVRIYGELEHNDHHCRDCDSEWTGSDESDKK